MVVLQSPVGKNLNQFITYFSEEFKNYAEKKPEYASIFCRYQEINSPQNVLQSMLQCADIQGNGIEKSEVKVTPSEVTDIQTEAKVNDTQSEAKVTQKETENEAHVVRVNKTQTEADSLENEVKVNHNDLQNEVTVNHVNSHFKSE